MCKIYFFHFPYQERPVSPGQELKESTMLALHEVTQALARQQDPPPSRKGGRLLKGK